MSTNRISTAKEHYETPAAVAHYSRRAGLLYKEREALSRIPPRSRVLGLGCGTGRTTMCIAAEGHDVTGVDVAEAMIAAARRRTSSVRYLVGDASELSFCSTEFDAVVFPDSGIDLLYPYEKRLAALREIRRVLRPGGLFLMGAHNHCIPRDLRGVPPFLRSLVAGPRHGYVDDLHDPWGAVRVYLTTPEIQIEELRQAGFEPVELIQRRILRRVRSLRLIGLIDQWCFYVSRRAAV